MTNDCGIDSRVIISESNNCHLKYPKKINFPLFINCYINKTSQKCRFGINVHFIGTRFVKKIFKKKINQISETQSKPSTDDIDRLLNKTP